MEDIPIERSNERNADSDVLALLGKKEVLKRRFGLLSIFSFATCELITWETVLALFSQGLNNGGPAGLVYGFLIAWLSTLSVYVVISELASMAPIAGGQYYWVKTFLCIHSETNLSDTVRPSTGLHACAYAIQEVLELYHWLAYQSGLDRYRGHRIDLCRNHDPRLDHLGLPRLCFKAMARDINYLGCHFSGYLY